MFTKHIYQYSRQKAQYFEGYRNIRHMTCLMCGLWVVRGQEGWSQGQARDHGQASSLGLSQEAAAEDRTGNTQTVSGSVSRQMWDQEQIFSHAGSRIGRRVSLSEAILMFNETHTVVCFYCH